MDHKQSGWVNLLYEIERSRRRIRIVCISIKDKTMQRLLWSDFSPNFLRMICSLWGSPIYPREMVVICEFCGFSSLLEPTTMPLDCTMGTVSRYSTATTGRSNFHTVVCQSVCQSPLYLRPRYRARHRLCCITGTETVSLPGHATRLWDWRNIITSNWASLVVSLFYLACHLACTALAEKLLQNKQRV